MPPIRPEDYAYRFRPGIIREIRTHLDLTQVQLAEMLDIPANTLSRWEVGSNVPDANALAAIYSVAIERQVKPEFFEVRTKHRIARKNRLDLIIHWDYQNFALQNYLVSDLASSLMSYMTLLYPNSSLRAARAFGAAFPPGVEDQLKFSGFDLSFSYGNIGALLTRETESLFDIAVQVDSQASTPTEYIIQQVLPVSHFAMATKFDPSKAVFVLITNDGDYGDLLKILSDEGADVFLCGSSECKENLIKAVGAENFLPWRLPYVINKFFEVAVAQKEKPLVKGELGIMCRRAMEEDEFDQDDIDRIMEETGFSRKRPYGSALQHMVNLGLIRERQIGNDPHRIRIEVQRGEDFS